MTRVSLRSSLFRLDFQPQHVQEPYLALPQCNDFLRDALESKAVAMRHSRLKPRSSSCTPLSLSFTAPGNDQSGRKTFPRMIDTTNPE